MVAGCFNSRDFLDELFPVRSTSPAPTREKNRISVVHAVVHFRSTNSVTYLKVRPKSDQRRTQFFLTSFRSSL